MLIFPGQNPARGNSASAHWNSLQTSKQGKEAKVNTPPGIRK